MLTVTDPIEVWSYENWNKLHPDLREDIVKHLLKSIPESNLKQLLEERKKVNSFMQIPFFHFGFGMGLRNLCRDIFLDSQLPDVKQPNGQMAKNWDDFYLGACYDLMKRIES